MCVSYMHTRTRTVFINLCSLKKSKTITSLVEMIILVPDCSLDIPFPIREARAFGKMADSRFNTGNIDDEPGVS